jgi:protocatechuate 3,4-dioxygenase beta subunit
MPARPGFESVGVTTHDLQKRLLTGELAATTWIAIAAAAAMLIAPSAAAAATAISGTVTDTGEAPIQNISVCAFDAGTEFSPPQGCANTNPSGEYEIDVSAGAHKVQFSSFEAPGYVRQYFNGKASFSTADAVTVSSGETKTGIDAKLEQGGAIGGTVVDTAEAPIASLQVCAQKVSGESFEPRDCSQTNASGQYTIVGLPGGEYRVQFTNSSCGGEGCVHLNYAPEYYDNKTSAGTADPVVVTLGTTKTGIDAELEKGASISGTVTDTGKSPLEGINVCVQRKSDGLTECMQTGAEGKYKVIGLPGGEYRIGFLPAESSYYIPQYYDHKSHIYEADLLAVAAGQAKAGIGAELEKGGAISGTVVDIAKEPIEGIQVCANEPTIQFGPPVNCTQTNADGEYRFLLPAGSYKIQFTNNSCGPEGCVQLNYVPQYYDGKPRFSEADPVTISVAAVTAGVDAEMEEGAELSGTVTDTSAEPIEGIQVCVQDAESGEGWTCNQTGEDGEYKMAGIPAGKYKVQFTNNSCGPEGCVQLNYVPQYYDGKDNFEEADVLDLSPGDALASIDAALEEGAQIEGTVTNGSAEPIEGIQVCVADATAEWFDEPMWCSQTDAEGDYTIAGLRTGAYAVQFSGNSCGELGCFQLNYVREFYDDRANFKEADPVSVGVGDTLTGIDAELEEGAEISGTVTDAGEAPIEGVQVCAQDAESGEGWWCNQADGEGKYTVAGLPAGKYVVEFSGNSCGGLGCFQLNYARQYWNGKDRFEEADVLDLSVGEAATGIDAEMEEGATISGTVTDANGAPLMNMQVCPYDAQSGDFEEGEERCAFTDAVGEYEIAGLGTGEYKVQFTNWTCGEEECTQLNYVRQYWKGKASFDEADPIDVAAGDVVTGIDAELQKGAGIAGTVTDASTGEPIEQTLVCLQAADGEFVEGAGCDQTDAAGDYAIVGIPPGEYKVEFSAESCSEEGCFQLNYVRQYYDGKASFEEADVLSLSAGETAEGIDAELEEGGRISGTVIDASSGEPIEGFQVCAFIPESEFGNCANTDASGEYTLVGLPTGAYVVEFSNWSCQGEDECVELYYVRQYYDEATSFDEADPVSVTAGATTGEIDAVLEKGGAIAGKVTDASTGKPIEEASVCFYEAGGGSEPLECVGIDESGEYKLVLLAGSYKVEFSAPGYTTEFYDGKGSLAAANPVSVATGATHGGVDASLATPVTPPGPTPTPTPTPAPSPPAPETLQPPGIAQVAATAKVKGGKALLRMTCNAPAACKGVVKLVARVAGRSVAIGKASFSVPAGASKTIGVKLTGKGKTLVRQAGARGLKVKLTGSGVKSRMVTLKA